MMARQVVGFLYRCSPAWSADGRFLAHATGGALWQWDLGTDAVERLLDFSPARLRYLPSGHLLFASVNPDSGHTLHLLDPESGVIDEEIASSRAFDWDVSPDGTRLYVTHHFEADPDGPAAWSELWEYELPRRGRRLALIEKGPGPLWPCVAPDGASVLYLGREASRPALRLWDRASGQTRTLLAGGGDLACGENPCGPLAWRDSRQVFYYTSGTNDIKDLTYTPWRLTLAAGPAKPARTAKPAEPVCDTPFYNPRPPVFSADGRRLALTVGARREFADPGRILLFDLRKGTHETLLDAWCPAFDPGHSRLAFLSPWPANRRAEHLFVRNLVNGEERSLNLPRSVE